MLQLWYLGPLVREDGASVDVAIAKCQMTISEGEIQGVTLLRTLVTVPRSQALFGEKKRDAAVDDSCVAPATDAA